MLCASIVHERLADPIGQTYQKRDSKTFNTLRPLKASNVARYTAHVTPTTTIRERKKSSLA